MELGQSYTGTRKRSGLKVRDVWYQTDQTYTDADVVYYMNVDQPIGSDVTEFHTLLIDLDLAQEELWSAVRKKTKYEINFARNRDELIHEVHNNPDDKVLEHFLEEFKLFADYKNIPFADVARLKLYQSLKCLTLTSVKDKEGNVLVWHVYRSNQDRCYLLNSVSMWFRNDDRKLIGRANRFCHWMDIEAFKANQVKYCDMGGWYHKDDNKDLLNINKFKESFGGFTVENYLCIDYPTWKGKLFYLMKKLTGKA